MFMTAALMWIVLLSSPGKMPGPLIEGSDDLVKVQSH